MAGDDAGRGGRRPAQPESAGASPTPTRSDGTLRTHAGTFGPGSFVWFPEGMLMEHGATDDGDMVALFITNKPFDIRYAFEDE